MNETTQATPKQRTSAKQHALEQELAAERRKREAAEQALEQTQAVLRDALAGEAGDLWAVELSDENDELEPDELLVRARTKEEALAALEGHCRLRADGWETRDFSVRLWRVLDGAGLLGVEDAGKHGLRAETLCRDCGASESAHLKQGGCARYVLGTEVHLTAREADGDWAGGHR